MDDTGWHEEPEYRPEPERGRPARDAFRLLFQFDGDRVELVDTQRLRKLVPPMTGEPPQEGKHYGEWIHVLDGDDRVLFTRLLNDPLGTRVEVHDPERGPRIVVGPPGQGSFDVLIPDLPAGAAVVLYASPPAVGKKGLRPAVPIGRFDLPRHGYQPGSES